MPPPRTVRGFGFADRLKDLSKERGGPANIGKILAFTEDETQPPLSIEVPNVRKFAFHVLRTIESIKWTKIEVFNTRKPPELILSHTRCPDDESGATELEDIGGGAALTDHGKVVLMMNACASIIFKSQDVVLTRHESSQRTLLDGYKELVSSSVKQFAIAEDRSIALQQHNHQLTDELVRTRIQLLTAGPKTDEPGSESGKVLDQILPDLIRAGLDHFVKGDRKPAASAPPNGANGHAKKAAAGS